MHRQHAKSRIQTMMIVVLPAWANKEGPKTHTHAHTHIYYVRTLPKVIRIRLSWMTMFLSFLVGYCTLRDVGEGYCVYRRISTDRCQNKSNQLVIAEPCWDVYRSRDRMKTFWGYIACILEKNTFVATVLFETLIMYQLSIIMYGINKLRSSH